MATAHTVSKKRSYDLDANSATSPMTGVTKQPKLHSETSCKRDPPYTVFISHAGEDKATIAFPLREKLLKYGITAFVDEADIPAGTKAVNEMKSAMETARVAIIVLSPEFVVRKWPMKELMCFLRRLEESSGDDVEVPVVIPFFYRLTIDDLYLEPRLDRLDKDGKRLCSKSRFFERMKNGEPEADIEAVEASLRKLHGIMGVRNDFEASNDSAHIMYRRREVLLQELFEKIQAVAHSVPLKENVNLRERTETANAFHAYFDTTQTISDLMFDFSHQEEDRKPCSQEARLLAMVLDESQTEQTSIAIRGIPGVGKTSLMHAMSRLNAVKERFTDGVYYLSIGMDGTKRDLIRELTNALEASGGKERSESLRREEKIERMIQRFRLWFAKRKCLFIVDDISQTREISANVIHELLRLAVSGEESKVLLTTRSRDIASRANLYFDLEPRGTVDIESRKILMRYAGMKPKDDKDDKSVNEILKRCSGLPLFLAVAGKAIHALTMRPGHDRCAAYHAYAQKLRGKVPNMLTTDVDLHERLDTSLNICLDLMEQRRKDFGFTVRLNVREMHRRLSVVRKQSKVPMTMLKLLWEVDDEGQAAFIAGEFENVGLADVVFEKRKSGYVEFLKLHDSLFEFALMETRKNQEERTGHEALLKGYGCGLTMRNGCHNWWDSRIERDEYVHANLCRHLLAARRIVELAYLLLSPQWTTRQVEKNGILFVEADFSLGITAVQDLKRDMNDEELSEVKEAIDLISRAVTLSSGFISSNIAELPFQLHGRLKRYCENNRAIRTYVSWFETDATRPLILCKTSFLGEAGTANTRIIPIGIDVLCIVMVQNGEQFAFGCIDGRIALVNVKRSVVEEEWKAHDDSVRAIAISSDGTRLVSGSSDKTAKVWDVKTADRVTSFTDHTDWVNDVAVMKDGRRVISVSKDHTARVWTLETGQILSKPFMFHNGPIYCVAVLGTEEDIVMTGGNDARLRMWNVTSGVQVGGIFDGHDDEVNCVTVTPDGRHVVSGSWDNTVRVWDVGSHQQIGKSLKGHTDDIRCVAVSGDGSRIVSGSQDNGIRVWDLESHKEICDPLERHTGFVSGVSFLAGVSDYIVSCSYDGTLRVWDVTRRNPKGLRNRHKSLVSGVSFTPDGEHVVSGSLDGTLGIWDTSSGEQVRDLLQGPLKVITDVSVSSNLRYAVTVSGEKKICIWDLKALKVLRTLTGHDDLIWCVAVTPRGNRVVTGSDDKTVRIWDLGAIDDSHVVLYGHSYSVENVYVSDDGLRIVSVDVNENIFVWELETKKLLRKFTQKDSWKLSKSEIFNVIGERTHHDDTTLSIPRFGREILYGEGANQKVLATMESDILSWALSRDEKTICVGLYDGKVALMKLET